MNAEKILIDTSVWIDYLRNKSSAVSERVDKILSENEVYVPKIVLAELIQGAKSEREMTVIKDFIDAFHIIDQKEDSWIKAGQLSYNLKKRGKAVHLIDCYISVIAQEYDCKIFTLDEHFKEIQRITDINLVL